MEGESGYDEAGGGRTGTAGSRAVGADSRPCETKGQKVGVLRATRGV
jgi:hypothetical protein